MKIKEIYHLAIEKGIERDPRSKDFVRKLLEKENKLYGEMSEEDKKEYDLDSCLTHTATREFCMVTRSGRLPGCWRVLRWRPRKCFWPTVCPHRVKLT